MEKNKKEWFYPEDGGVFSVDDVVCVMQEEDLFHRYAWNVSFSNGKSYEITDADFAKLKIQMHYGEESAKTE